MFAMYYRSLGGLSILYFRTITYTSMHACARALHDAVTASTPAASSLYSSSGSKNSAGGEGFCAGIAAVKISLWWVVPVLYGRNSY